MNKHLHRYALALAVIALAVGIFCYTANAWETVPWPRESNPAHEPQRIITPTAYGYTDADRKRLREVQRVISQQSNSATPDAALVATMRAERDRLLAKRRPWLEAMAQEVARRCGPNPTEACIASIVDNAK